MSFEFKAVFVKSKTDWYIVSKPATSVPPSCVQGCSTALDVCIQSSGNRTLALCVCHEEAVACLKAVESDTCEIGSAEDSLNELLGGACGIYLRPFPA